MINGDFHKMLLPSSLHRLHANSMRIIVIFVSRNDKIWTNTIIRTEFACNLCRADGTTGQHFMEIAKSNRGFLFAS